MANRPANTQQFNLRPPSTLVETLSRLYAQCGAKTPNELAVELIAAGAQMIEDKNSPPAVPGTILALRARLRGAPVEEPTAEQPALQAQIRQMVEEIFAEHLASQSSQEASRRTEQEESQVPTPRRSKKAAK